MLAAYLMKVVLFDIIERGWGIYYEHYFAWFYQNL